MEQIQKISKSRIKNLFISLIFLALKFSNVKIMILSCYRYRENFFKSVFRNINKTNDGFN
jgi:hypothetical protein